MSKMISLVTALVLITAIAASVLAESSGPTTRPDSWAGRSGAWGEARGARGDAEAWTGPTNQQVREALSLLREIDAEQAQAVEGWLQTNPARARRAITPLFPKLSELHYLKTHNPELFKLRAADYRMNNATQELADQYHQAVLAKDQAKVKAVGDQLRAKITEHFALRQKFQETELATLEKRIAELRDQIAKRKKAQTELISARYQELVGAQTQPSW